MQIVPVLALAGVAAAARPDNSKTFIFSYPHHTYTKTLYGEKAEHLTTTHMTIARPHHTHTKTFFTWIGNGAAPTDVEDVPGDDGAEAEEKPEEKPQTSEEKPSLKETAAAEETAAQEPSVASQAAETSSNDTVPKVSSIFEGGAAAAGMGAGSLAVALLLL